MLQENYESTQELSSPKIDSNDQITPNNSLEIQKDIRIPKKIKIAFMFLILIIVLLLITIFQISKNSNDKNLAQSSPLPESNIVENTPINKLEATALPTAEYNAVDYEMLNNNELGYSFSYPKTWDILSTYYENNVGSAHYLTNYKLEDIEKYSDHGITDWKGFLGNNPAIKAEIYIFNTELENKIYMEIDSNTPNFERIENGLQIDSLDTQVFLSINNSDSLAGPFDNHMTVQAKSISKLVQIQIYISNTELVNLEQSQDWNNLKNILKSMKFN